MAKKRTETGGKKMPAIAEETKVVLVRLEIPVNVQRQFRVEASRERLSRAKTARR